MLLDTGQSWSEDNSRTQSKLYQREQDGHVLPSEHLEAGGVLGCEDRAGERPMSWRRIIKKRMNTIHSMTRTSWEVQQTLSCLKYICDGSERGALPPHWRPFPSPPLLPSFPRTDWTPTVYNCRDCLIFSVWQLIMCIFSVLSLFFIYVSA